MFDSSKSLAKRVFFLFFLFCFVNCGNSTCKRGSLRRPHPTYPKGPIVRTFSTLQKKPLLSDFKYLVLKQAGPKNLPKNIHFFGTGSRRGVTPGRLGAQNRWLLKGFLLEGSRHWTCGRDRPGALAPRRAAAQRRW